VSRSKLNRIEIARAERFRLALDYTSFVVAHAIPRLMALQHRPASGTLSLMPREDRRFGVWKKNDTPGVSLSHARGCAACLVGRPHDVWFDVEACDLAAPDDIPPA